MTVAALVSLIAALRPLLSLIKEAKDILKRNGELTPEAEAELDAAIASLQADETKPAHWKVEP